jgi:subtilisin-like proprotein convertase family protein
MKMYSKKVILAAALFVTAAASAMVPGTISESWSGAQIIPDNNASGVAFSFNVAAGGPLLVTNVAVSLNIAGGWNGDLYAYLSHGSGFSVLLNRVGRTAGNSAGAGVSGMNLSLSDSYLTDVHTAANNPLTGNFAPDGRFVNPFNAVDIDARSAFLSSFNNLDPNGTWTLFFADVAPLAVSTIQSWTVNVGVATPVPEPGVAALLGLPILIGAMRRHRQHVRARAV